MNDFLITNYLILDLIILFFGLNIGIALVVVISVILIKLLERKNE